MLIFIPNFTLNVTNVGPRLKTGNGNKDTDQSALIITSCSYLTKVVKLRNRNILEVISNVDPCFSRFL